MLYSKQTNQQVHIDQRRALTDNEKRNTREVNEPLDYKGHAYFKLEERAVIKQ